MTETNLESTPSHFLPNMILSITSYGRTFGPLIPTPDLSISVINLPNPPAQVRRKYVGLSLRLRAEFFKDKEVTEKFEKELQKVREKMREFEEKRGEMSSEKSGEAVLKVGVQCAMGRHRSVAFAEEMAERISEDLKSKKDGSPKWSFEVWHRDIGGRSGLKGNRKSENHGRKFRK